MARSLAVALDDLGVGEGARVAIVSPNAARFLVALFGVSVFGRVLVPVNFRLNAEEIRYIVEHSGSTVALVDPGDGRDVRAIPVTHRFVLGTATDAAALRADRRAPAGPRDRRERHGLHQLHVGHDGAPEGRAAHAPGLLAQRGHLRLARRGVRPRRVPAHAAHVPLQRLGHALRAHRHGRASRDHPEDRRRGDPPARRRRGRDAASTARPRWSPRCWTRRPGAARAR